jgi:hypothetical protein
LEKSLSFLLFSLCPEGSLMKKFDEKWW